MALLSNKTILETQSDLKAGITTCEKLVSSFLQKIEETKHLNAFLEVFSVEATGRAKELDKKLAEGKQTGKLFGCVIAIKDNICYKQHKVSAASKILE